MSEFAKGAVKSYFSVAGAQFFSVPLSLLYLSLVTRNTGPVNYGRFALALAAFQFFYTLCVSWLRSATIRFGAEEYTKHNKLSVIFCVQVVVLSFVVAVSSLLIFILRKNIVDFTGLEQPVVTYLMVYLVVYSGFDFMCQLLQAVNKMHIYALGLVLRQAAVLILFSLLIMLNSSISPLNLILIESFSCLLISAFLAFSIFKRRYFMPLRFDAKMFSQSLRYSWPMMILFALGYSMLWADTLLIRHFLNFESVGRYEAANRLMQYISNMILPLSIVAFPIAVSIKSKGREDLIHKYAQRIIPQSSFFWGIFIILFMLGSGFIFKVIFGPQYTISVLAFQILLIGLSFQFLSVMYSAVLQSYDLNHELVYIAAVSVALNLSGDFLLIPKAGIIGAACSKSVSIIVAGLLYMHRSIKCVHIQGKSYKDSTFFLSLPLFTMAGIFIFPGSPFYSYIFAACCVTASIYFIKKRRVFTAEDINFIKQLTLPGFVKSGIESIYKKLI